MVEKKTLISETNRLVGETLKGEVPLRKRLSIAYVENRLVRETLAEENNITSETKGLAGGDFFTYEKTFQFRMPN